MKDLNEKGKFILEKEELNKMRKDFCAESLSDKEIQFTIDEIYKNHKELIDPHTAIGVGVMKKISLKENTVVLATAHPSKFYDVVLNATNTEPKLPNDLKYILNSEEKFEKLSSNLNDVKKYMLERI